MVRILAEEEVMRPSKFTENEILYAAKQLEVGISVKELAQIALPEPGAL